MVLAAVLASLAAVVSTTNSTAKSTSSTHNKNSAHWGIVTRNTIGSPVGDHRNGPYGTFGVTGPLARPPFGTGSLGIEVSGGTEKVDFGNEVDFFGDNFLNVNQIGFHVFQTGENIGYGGLENMPNIRLEMDPNVPGDTNNYVTLVFVPDASPQVNRWSGYIDATNTGYWYFTGIEPPATICNQATQCSFAAAKAALSDGPPPPFTYTVQVGKGRDFQWIGAVDGLRINSSIFDFELFGVFERRVGGGHDDDDD